MDYPINCNKIETDLELYSEVIAAHKEAVTYIKSFNWCEEIFDSSLYLNIGSSLCIFLFKINNTASKDDDLLWIVVGDIPPMYLDIHCVKTTKQVLENYIALAGDWIQAVKSEGNVEDCYPFDAEPNLEMADLLNQRMFFIRDVVLKNIDDTPISC